VISRFACIQIINTVIHTFSTNLKLNSTNIMIIAYVTADDLSSHLTDAKIADLVANQT